MLSKKSIKTIRKCREDLLNNRGIFSKHKKKNNLDYRNIIEDGKPIKKKGG